MSERLDEERLEVLRRWGVGLSTDGREELRAAGKAITLLVDEVDRLQVDVWHARVATGSREGASGAAEAGADTITEDEGPPELDATLRGRLGAVLPSLSAKNDP